MQLHYIWIKKFKNLENIGLNFSNQFRFNYDVEKSSLSLTNTPNFIPDFFGTNISSLTALVGANGTGKTNTIRLILNTLVSGINSELPESIIIFSTSGKLNIFISEQLTITYDDSKLKRVPDLNHIRNNLNLIFYSNFFDPQPSTLDLTKDKFAGQINISSFYLFDHDYEQRQNDGKNPSNRTFQEFLQAHRKMELNRQVRLIRKYNKGELLLNIPKYLVIEINDLDEQQVKVKYDKIGIAFHDMEKRALDRIDKKELFFLTYFRASIFNFLNQLEYTSKIDLPTIVNNLENELEKNIWQESAFNNVLAQKFSRSLGDALKEKYPAFSQLISQNYDIMQELSGLVDKKSISLDSKSCVIDISKSRINQIFSLIDKCFDKQMITSEIDFRFSFSRFEETPFSSGEYTLFSFFSRLNELKKKDISKNSILLIDEAELALHPAWQTKFLSIMLNFLDKEFPSKRLQVIITSHSPFIVSDLPPHCIIFLKKENELTKIIDGLNGRISTFGANIHELFTDSFFLKDGLMGEFARNKIANLIKEINSDETITVESYENCYKNRVEIIGEQFLKSKIIELIVEKGEVDLADQVISDRTNELDNLKRISNSKRHD